MRRTTRSSIPLTLAILALASLVPLIAFASTGDDSEVEEIRLKAVIAGDDGGPEVISLDASDLEIGDSRQLYTDSGKEVVFTRTEDGFDITVDGEELEMPTIAKHVQVLTEGEAGESYHVRKLVIADGTVHSDGEHSGHAYHFGEHSDGEGPHAVFITTDGEATTFDVEMDDVHWQSDDGVQVFGHGLGAAHHLEESGALDDLDDATRQRVLDALEDYEGPGHGKKVYVVKSKVDVHDSHE